MLFHLPQFQRSLRVVPEPAPVYTALRSRILHLSPVEIGLKPSAQLPSLWGILMEMGFPNGVATLACLAEGTTSLYYSNGGGILGSGEVETVAKASQAFLRAAEMSTLQMEAATVLPLPRPGQVRFYTLTYGGVFTSEVAERVLNRGKHPLTRLFYYGQEVLTQIRLQEEQRARRKDG
jgi:hypothetical protein